MAREESRIVERIRYIPKMDSTIEGWQIGEGKPPRWVLEFFARNDLILHEAGVLEGFRTGNNFIYKYAKIYPKGSYVVRIGKKDTMIFLKETFEQLFEPVEFFYRVANDCKTYNKRPINKQTKI